MDVDVVNVMPVTLSAETSQDSEPSIAVNPENPDEIVITAFTPKPGWRGERTHLRLDRRWRELGPQRQGAQPAGQHHGHRRHQDGVRGTGGRLYGGILRRPGSLRPNVIGAPNATGPAP